MTKPAQQLPLDFVYRSALGRDDFLIGPSNQDAVAWVDRWPDWPAPALILSGSAASGKTHLAAVWHERTKAEIIRPEMLLANSAEKIASVNKYLIFDGLDPWLGYEEAETTLFHLYNIFKEEQRTFLVTMRMVPAQIQFAIADLASRFRAAPVAEIFPPDDVLLASVLIKLFSDRQLNVSNDVIQYLLPRMERSLVAARDIVAKTDRVALAEKRRVSVPLMRKVLTELQEEY